MAESIADRLHTVQDKLATAARDAGRDPAEITLVAVSKFQPVEAVVEAIEAGQRHFGENRFQGTPVKIQSVREQYPGLSDDLHWHFIGGLQSNKVKPVLEWFDRVQSIDRKKLLKRADRIAEELGRKVEILLQVNVSGADTQGGADPDDLPALAETAATLEHVHLRGLMAIGPNTDDRDQIRRGFARVRQAADEIRAMDLPGVTMDTLSMGMTSDYAIAIAEGATLVRIGTAIFGPRPT